MTGELRDDVELSSRLLYAPLNTVIRQHPELFCLPLYWTQQQWSILRVQILHYAYNAECQSTINLNPIACIRLPKLPVNRVRQCIDQLNCSLWFRWPDQKIAAMRSLLTGWESGDNCLEIHRGRLPLSYGSQIFDYLLGIGTYSFSNAGGEWELAHVDGSHLTEARRKHPMKARYRIPGNESQGQNNLFCIPGLLIAMAQNHLYRQQLQPAEQTVSARTKRFRFCVLFTDSKADNSAVHLYTTSSLDILIKLLQIPEKPLQLEAPWPSHVPFLAIEHIPIAYKPYKSFRVRLRNAIFQIQDSEGPRKRKQSQATSPNKKRCTLGY